MHSNRLLLFSISYFGLLLAIAITASPAAIADDLADEPDEATGGFASEGSDTPSAPEAGDELTADEIYSRVLQNRFQTSVQELVLESVDRTGREQKIRMQRLWKRYESGADAEKGIQSRTVVRYMEPSEMRRIRRINLRGESVVGTDLSLEDIVPREMDDATYRRVSDEEVTGTRCFVVEAMPKPELPNRYFTQRQPESKKLRLPADVTKAARRFEEG